MLIRLTDPPQRPLPQRPQPEQPAPRQVQPPMIYVYETPGWEYKVVVRDTTQAVLLSEHELNDLGASGWELAGVAGLPGTVQCYFKRVRK
jgi:hypothetical protein